MEEKKHEQKAFHYLPQFLLEGFKTGSFLHEFNMITGVSGKKAINEAGSREHFYHPELEQGYLAQADREGAEIFQKNFFGADTDASGGVFEISDNDTVIKLASFLALFTLRTPAAFELAKDAAEEHNNNPKAMAESVRQRPIIAIDTIRMKHPEQYAEFVAKYGKQKADEMIVQSAIKVAESGRLPGKADPKNVFNIGINEERAKMIGTALSKMKWTLIQTPDDEPFFISDFPLCVWREGQHVGFQTFTSTDVQITMPLTNRLTLLMTHTKPDAAQIETLADGELNYRQMVAGLETIYGSEHLTDIVKQMHEAGKATGTLPAGWHPGPAGWSPKRSKQ